MRFLIKVGGSLIPRHMPRLCSALRSTNRTAGHSVFLFPGGGAFADLIREYRTILHLTDERTHIMALASLDQNAQLISQSCGCPVVTTWREMSALKRGMAVIAPYRILSEQTPFSGHSLNIDSLSSDSSALYFAYRLACRFVVATDVDGVFTRDPARSQKAAGTLLSETDTAYIRSLTRGGPLDDTLPKLMDAWHMNAWVVNGKKPAAVCGLLKSGAAHAGTFIRCRRS